MGDKNEQYLLDHWCDCRRYCRAVLSWASLTPELERRRGGAALTEEGWWPVTFRRPAAVLSLDLGGLQSLLAESRVCERHIEGPHPLDPLPRSPPTGLVAVCRPSWRCGWSLCQVTVGCTGTSRSWSRPCWCVCPKPPAGTRCSCSRSGHSTMRPAGPGPSDSCR